MGGAILDQSVLLDKVRRYFEYAGTDVDRAQCPGPAAVHAWTYSDRRHDARSPNAANFFSPAISGAHHRPSRQNMTRSPARCPAR